MLIFAVSLSRFPYECGKFFTQNAKRVDTPIAITNLYIKLSQIANLMIEFSHPTHVILLINYLTSLVQT